MSVYQFVNTVDASESQISIVTESGNHFIRFGLLGDANLKTIQSLKVGGRVGFYQDGSRVADAEIVAVYDGTSGLQIDAVPTLVVDQNYELRFTQSTSSSTATATSGTSVVINASADNLIFVNELPPATVANQVAIFFEDVTSGLDYYDVDGRTRLTSAVKDVAVKNVNGRWQKQTKFSPEEVAIDDFAINTAFSQHVPFVHGSVLYRVTAPEGIPLDNTQTVPQLLAANKIETLGADITALTSSINQEVSDRQSADSTLQTNIDTEVSDRQSADSTLQTNIDNEVTARTDADNTLQSNIDNVVAGLPPVGMGLVVKEGIPGIPSRSDFAGNYVLILGEPLEKIHSANKIKVNIGGVQVHPHTGTTTDWTLTDLLIPFQIATNDANALQIADSTLGSEVAVTVTFYNGTTEVDALNVAFGIGSEYATSQGAGLTSSAVNSLIQTYITDNDIITRDRLNQAIAGLGLGINSQLDADEIGTWGYESGTGNPSNQRFKIGDHFVRVSVNDSGGNSKQTELQAFAEKEGLVIASGGVGGRHIFVVRGHSTASGVVTFLGDWDGGSAPTLTGNATISRIPRRINLGGLTRYQDISDTDNADVKTISTTGLITKHDGTTEQLALSGSSSQAAKLETVELGAVEVINFSEDAVAPATGSYSFLGGGVTGNGLHVTLSYNDIHNKLYKFASPSGGTKILLGDLNLVNTNAERSAIDGSKLFMGNTGTGTATFQIGGIGSVFPAGATVKPGQLNRILLSASRDGTNFEDGKLFNLTVAPFASTSAVAGDGQLLTGTAVPASSLGKQGDTYLRDNGEVYNRGSTNWVKVADLVTQAELTAAIPAVSTIYLDPRGSTAKTAAAVAGDYTLTMTRFGPKMTEADSITINVGGELVVDEQAWTTGKRFYNFTISQTNANSLISNVGSADHLNVDVVFKDGTTTLETISLDFPFDVPEAPSSSGGLTQSQVDARIATWGRAGNTTVIPASKLAAGTLTDVIEAGSSADKLDYVTGLRNKPSTGLSNLQVRALIADWAESYSSSVIPSNKLPDVEVIFDGNLASATQNQPTTQNNSAGIQNAKLIVARWQNGTASISGDDFRDGDQITIRDHDGNYASVGRRVVLGTTQLASFAYGKDSNFTYNLTHIYGFL